MMTAPSHRGTISFALLFVVLAFVLLFAWVANGWSATLHKIRTQNRADDSTNAGAVVVARGLNQITLANHLMGETTAVAIIAKTYGGPELTDGRGIALDEPDFEIAYQSAVVAGVITGVMPDSDSYRLASVSRSRSGGAIGDARKTLKSLLAASYRRHPDSPTHERAEQAALAQEWHELDRLEARAMESFVPLAKMCLETIVPELNQHTDRIVRLIPDQIAQAILAHGGTASSISLPVVRDSAKAEHRLLVRASTPFVQAWRTPIIDHARTHLPRSQFGDHFRRHSQQLTISMVDQLIHERGVVLFVLDREVQGIDVISVRVTVQSLARPIATGLVIPHQSPSTFSLARGIVGNRNGRKGLDTLNWHPADRVPTWAKGHDGETINQPPRIRLGWTARLAPLDRLPDDIPEPAATTIDRLAPPKWLLELN